jgi:hypothetical protein
MAQISVNYCDPDPSHSINAGWGWLGNTDLPVEIQRDPADLASDPSAPCGAYWAQAHSWGPVQAVLAGTEGLAQLNDKYIPRLPTEQPVAWGRRCQRAVLSPFLQRIIKASVGLVLRKPIALHGGDEAWWQAWRGNVNRHGSSLEEFCTKVLFDAIAYGHNGWLVDAPISTARSLQQQLEEGAMPYFVRYETPNVIGWRESQGGKGGVLSQLRLRELVTEPHGLFGEETVRQVRVLEPGQWATYREMENRDGWRLHQQGRTNLQVVPYTAVYSQREGMLTSSPPLLEIANLNLQHYTLQAQLLHCLHVAAQPILVLKGWNNTKQEICVGVDSALQLPLGGDASYVVANASAFDGLHQELASLEQQMANLGIAILARQKNVAESGLSKQLDRADTNSMLAVLSADLENSLQEAINWVATFANVEPPVVQLDTDFDASSMEPSTITALGGLYRDGAIDQRTLLEALQRGELFGPTFDMEAVLEAADAEALLAMEGAMPPAAPVAPDPAVVQPTQPVAAMQETGTGPAAGG